MDCESDPFINACTCKTTGVISHYSPRSGKHHIRYDDGDERDYVLRDKVYEFLEDDGQQRGGGGGGEDFSSSASSSPR